MHYFVKHNRDIIAGFEDRQDAEIFCSSAGKEKLEIVYIKNQRGAGRKKSADTKSRAEEAQYMRFNGYGINEIAKEMGVSRQTVNRWLKIELD